MRRSKRLLAILLIMGIFFAAGCSRNYYSGTGKGSNCGCPSHKGMSGY